MLLIALNFSFDQLHIILVTTITLQKREKKSFYFFKNFYLVSPFTLLLQISFIANKHIFEFPKVSGDKKSTGKCKKWGTKVV